MPRRPTTRVVHGAVIAIGALGGAALPFLSHAASNGRFTDIEARIGLGVSAILVNALFGAVAGWAIGALILHFWEYRR